MPQQRIRFARCLIGALTLALLAACSDDPQPADSGNERPAPTGTTPDPTPDPEPAPDPQPPAQETEWEELSALWRKAAAQPDTFDEEERVLLEALFSPLVPPIDGELIGSQWNVFTTLEGGQAELKASLMRAGGEIASLDMKYRLDLDGEEDPDFGGGEYAGYPAAVRNRFVFVLVGRVEMRMVGVAPFFRSTEKVGGLLERFPLSRIEEL